MDQLLDFFARLFDTSSWPPRWHCGQWTDFHGWLYIASDVAIWAVWAHEKDAVVQTIVTKQMIPRFKAGDYSAGLLAAVVALDAMARDVALPAGPTDWRGVTILIVFAALLVFTVVSLIRRGASGWAWVLWGVVFGVLGYVIYTAMTSSRSGGGFSGGSFGGGSSGGGGAGGAW